MEGSVTAKRQTRRSVSLSQQTYGNALWFANQRGMSLAQLVTIGLERMGVDVGPQTPMKIEDAEKATEKRWKGRDA